MRKSGTRTPAPSTRKRVRADSTSVGQVFQNLKTVHDDVMAFPPLEIGDENRLRMRHAQGTGCRGPENAAWHCEAWRIRHRGPWKVSVRICRSETRLSQLVESNHRPCPPPISKPSLSKHRELLCRDGVCSRPTSRSEPVPGHFRSRGAWTHVRPELRRRKPAKYDRSTHL